MYSLLTNFPEDMYVESSTPQDQQENKGWYYDSRTRKFYRWDNCPGSE